jgi:hypothetical protein
MLARRLDTFNFELLKKTTLWHAPPQIPAQMPAQPLNFINVLLGFIAVCSCLFCMANPTLITATVFGIALIVAALVIINNPSPPIIYGRSYVLTDDYLYFYELRNSRTQLQLAQAISVSKISVAQHKETESLIYTDSLTPIIVPQHDGKSLAKVLRQLHPNDIIDPDKA